MVYLMWGLRVQERDATPSIWEQIKKAHTMSHAYTHLVLYNNVFHPQFIYVVDKISNHCFIVIKLIKRPL